MNIKTILYTCLGAILSFGPIAAFAQQSADGIYEDILVENCTARSSASGFKIGTGSIGGFRNIRVNNLTVFDTYCSAIALETVDGAFIEDIGINNVRAINTGNAIFIRQGLPSGKPDIGYPMERPPPKVPPHNLPLSSVVGIPGHPVQNVTLSNIQISYGGGANKAKAYVQHLTALMKILTVFYKLQPLQGC